MAKMFQGKQTRQEEMAEAKAVRSGKVSPAEYARREKAEGDKASTKSLEARGKQLASGKMSADQYAGKAMPKMANGGMVQGYADGGLVGLHRASTSMVPNAPCMSHGPGVRSHQDYKK